MYYTEVNLQKSMQYYADKMSAELGLEVETEALSVEGKQWAFDWIDYGMMMGAEHMPSCLDFGVSAEGYFMAGVDYEALYGEEAAGMWMAAIEGYYEVEATDATSGIIYLLQADYVTGELSRAEMYIEYSNLTETTCTFNCPTFYLNNVEATVMDEVVNVMSQGIAM